MGIWDSFPARRRMLARAVVTLAGVAGMTMACSAGVASAASPGELNTSFAGGGNLLTQFGSGPSPTSGGDGVAVASNGDIYQVGGATVSGRDELYIARYLPSGQPDPSFD
ncbi:MAG: hypothetical protein ACRDL8_03610, partial [Solirubrobacteraceae bacterium]